MVKLAGDDIVKAARKQASEHGPLEVSSLFKLCLPFDHKLFNLFFGFRRKNLIGWLMNSNVAQHCCRFPQLIFTTET